MRWWSKLAPHTVKGARNAVVFLVGLAGITAETWVSLSRHESPDAELTLGFLAMMGVPIALNQDDNSQEHHDEHDHPRSRDGDDEPPRVDLRKRR